MEEHHSIDQVFIRKLTEIVLANLQNENFGVNELAREAGTSRFTINRRLKSILNQDTGHFISGIRLKRAMELLQNSEGTVAEIAFRVGFNSPAYFNKCFHEYFGITPGEIRKSSYSKAIKSTTDDHSVESGLHEEVTLKKAIENRGKSRHRKNLIITSIALLAGLVLFFSVYLLMIKDHKNGIVANHRGKTIVVLPFKNLTDNPENQHFADGIMEDVLDHLFRLKEFTVRSRTTAEYFRGNSMTSPEIARKLNVRYVLEGSVQRVDNKVRVFIQLIDARNDQHVLSDKIEGNMTDVFVLSSDIARKIADALKVVLTQEETGRIEKIPTRSPEAYEYYLKARFLVNRANDEQRTDLDGEGLMGSIKYFERAIAADRDFAEAYAGLADAWFNLAANAGYQPYSDGIRRAKEFCEKALEIDPGCSKAHAVKGAYLIWPGRKWEEGRDELMLSIQLNPNNAFAHQASAQLLMITGPIEEARRYMDRVIELEPYFWLMHNLNAWIYYFEGKYVKALEACRSARELKPDFILNNWLYFLNYAKLEEGEKAVVELQSIVRSNQKASIYEDEIVDVYNNYGVKGLFIWLTEINVNKPVPVVGLSGQPFFTAWWYAIINDKEKSIYWLEKNMESEYRNYTYFNLICTNPDFDIIRNDPRFIKIIDEIGLAPYNIRKSRYN